MALVPRFGPRVWLKKDMPLSYVLVRESFHSVDELRLLHVRVGSYDNRLRWVSVEV